MKRILIFSTAYLPLIGGAEIAVKEITERLKDYEFDLVCARLDSRFKKKEKIGQINVYRIGFGNKFDKILLPISGFLKAVRLYNNSKFQVPSSKFQIVIWGIMASWASLAALFFKIFYPKVPFLLTLQEGDSETYIRKGRFGLISFSWRLLLKKADFVQVISRYLADLAKRFGYQGQIEVVPNGVDLDKFSRLDVILRAQPEESFSHMRSFAKAQDDIKVKLGIKKNEKVIITVSRLVEKNGIEDLIEAVALLYGVLPLGRDKSHPKGWTPGLAPKAGLHLKLLILGSGPLEEKLKFQVSSFKLQDNILFLGNIPNEEVPKYLAMADVFVRPSLSEGLGSAFLEAMAAGLPIIGTPVGGIVDFLKDRETGLFCQPKNPKSIAEKIKILLSDEALRQKLIINARKLIEEKYDWEIIAQKMENIFNKLCVF